MKRWWFHITMALSLVLLPATAVLWHRSYRVADAWSGPIGRSGSYLVNSDIGVATLEIEVGPFSDNTGEFRHYATPQTTTAKDMQAIYSAAKWAVVGFSYYQGPSLVWFTVPYWSLTVLFLVFPLYNGIGFSRRRVRKWNALRHGAVPCRQCGYDLRGNPAATKCPECGGAITDEGKNAGAA